MVLATFAVVTSVLGGEGTHAPAELIGTWRGTSTCVDRVAAPGCHDEVVVYEFTAGAKPGVVDWKAYKIVGGEKQFMGPMDVAYDANETCWKGEFSSPRVHSVWRLVVDRDHMTGTAKLLPGNATFRVLDLHRE